MSNESAPLVLVSNRGPVTFQEDGSIRVDIPASVPGVTPSERDIVLGFARATAEGHLRVWASLMLATSNIEHCLGDVPGDDRA